MAKRNRSRKGSLAFRPRKRASRLVPRMSSWKPSQTVGLQGYVGVKAGMTTVMMIDDDKGSPTFGMEIAVPATVVEVPDVTVSAIRLYGSRPEGKYVITDIHTLDEIEKVDVSHVGDVSVLVSARAYREQKSPVTVEIAIGGTDVKKKIEYARSVLGKTVSCENVFSAGEYIDTKAVTKGKGWQGAVKRFGVALQRRKATGRRRHVGNLGPWHPAIVWYYAPQAGQHGFHTRTEFNKRILKIADASKDPITPKGGFVNYGEVRGKYLLLKGSIPGPRKRIVRMRKAWRPTEEVKSPELKMVSLASQQG